MRHLGVNDPATGGHPLHAARPEQTGIAFVVPVLHCPGEHVGHGFEAAMRMVREPGDVIPRIIGAKFVEQQERVEMIELIGGDDARHTHAGTVCRGHAG